MSFAERLLSWFDAYGRELPWRERRDPYAIWISEVMLQQTRVETVIPYYERFLERFPTVGALAAAPVDDVLAAWSGLGYYRRARQLHAAACEIVAGGGDFPETVEALGELPGVGPYTAAAIASIAFGVPCPVLDGNVERLLSRRLAYGANPRTAAGRRSLLLAAAESIDVSRPGDFNQAMMELGARICTPRDPNCHGCPVSGGCAGLAAGDPERYPVLPRRKPPVRERWVAVVVRSGGQLLLSRRRDDARLMAGLWELPWVEGEVADAAAALARSYGGEWRVGREAARVRHSVTVRSLEVSVCKGEWNAAAATEVAEAERLAWIEEGRLAELATSSLVAKTLAALDGS